MNNYHSFATNVYDQYNIIIVKANEDPIPTNIYSITIKYNEFDTYFNNDTNLKLFSTPSKCHISAAGLHFNYDTDYKVKTSTF